MTTLIIGILLWSGLHFIPTLARGFRKSLQDRFGEKPYAVGFSLGVLLSILLMVMGWTSADQWQLFQPPAWGRPVALVLIIIAFILFAMTKSKTNVKRHIRHPQLTGLVAWAIGHLLTNGDNLSFALFGGLGLWAVIEMFLINRRDGSWVKPEPTPMSGEVKPVLIGLVVFAVFLFAHPYLFGVSPFPPG